MNLKLSEFFPLIDIKGNTAITSNGDIIRFYKRLCPEVLSLGKDDFDKIHQTKFNAYKLFNDSTIIVDSDGFFTESFDAKLLPKTSHYEKVTASYFKGREYINHYAYTFFIYTADNFLKSDSIVNPFKKLPKKGDIDKYIEQVDQQFINQVDSTVEYINNSKIISLLPFEEQEVYNYSLFYLNGFYSDRNVDGVKENNSLVFGDKHVGAFSVQQAIQLPDNLSPAVIDDRRSDNRFKFYRGYADLLGFNLEFDHIYNQIYFIDSHRKLRGELETKKGNLFANRGFSDINKRQSEQLASYLTEMADDERIKLIRSHQNVIFFGNSKEALISNSKKVSANFQGLDIKPYYPKGNMLSSIYYCSFPGFTSHMSQNMAYTIDLQAALCFSFNVTNYRNDPEGIYFNDRLFNVPILRDIWSGKVKRTKARNFQIIAPTGEGKSFVALHILRQQLDQGYKVQINDLGDSYFKLSQLYKDSSEYIRFSPGKSLGLNPFFLQGEDLDTNKENNIIEQLRILWKREGSLTNEETVSLRKIVKAYYTTIPEEHHTFANLYKYIEFATKNKDLHTIIGSDNPELFNPEKFLHNCSEFVGSGSYAYLFPENSQDNFYVKDKQLVVFEFEEAKNDPLLVSILLGMSSEINHRFIWSDLRTRGVELNDEFAKQLEYPNVLSATQYKFQAIRKKNSSVGIVLQSPSQLPVGSTSDSIIDNTQVFYVLNNDKGYDPIVERLRLGEHHHEQMKSISNNFQSDNPYSELLLIIGKYSNVVRLEAPPELRYSYITEGDEHRKILDIYEQTDDMQEAIRRYMKQLNT